MTNEKTGLWNNGLLWFGAAVSIAEILTGALVAPLGFEKGAAAIVVGHLIGCLLLYGAGLIGAKTGRSAMESCRIAFGSKGSYLFSALNITQLIGWTAVMIIGGAKALQGLNLMAFGNSFWCLVIGGMIILWIALGMTRLGKLNVLAVGALFGLTILLSFIIFGGHEAIAVEGSMSFGMAVELSVAMPLSWLPLIADYTRQAKKPVKATAISVLAYCAGSTWMYLIGLGAAVFVGSADMTEIMLKAGLGVAALIIIVLSTVTTTFLDAYSAGVSFNNVSPKIDAQKSAIGVTIVGMAIAMFTPIEAYQGFLYWIGSVFAPMVAILLTHYFILGKTEETKVYDKTNLGLWAIGFLLYRQLLTLDTPLGSTVPVMFVIGALVVLMEKGVKPCFASR